MTLYKLCDWEQNGYHDSYFKAALFDDSNNTIVGVEIGSTAFGGGRGLPEPAPKGQTLVSAYITLENHIRVKLYQEALSRHNEPKPDDLKTDMILETTSKIRCAKRNKDMCQKCLGTGHWINPKNVKDKRECFACNGKGFHVSKVKGEWVRLDPHTPIIIDNWMSFGKFYRNGYNQPDRVNTTIYGHLTDGTIVTAKLAKLCCAGELPKEEMFREKAHALACEGQFQVATGIKCAWLTNHFAPIPDSFRNREPEHV
jgi:hypothetical protein